MQSGDSVVQRRAMHSRRLVQPWAPAERPGSSNSTSAEISIRGRASHVFKPRRDINLLAVEHRERVFLIVPLPVAAEIVARSPAGAGALGALRLLRNNNGPPFVRVSACVCVCISSEQCVSRAIVR